MLSRCAVEIHTLPVHQEYSLNILLFEGLLRPPYISPRQMGRQIFGIHLAYQETFLHPQASSSAPYPQELNSLWKKTIEEPHHMSTAEVRDQNETKIWDANLDRQPKIQLSSVEETILRIMVADQQRLQISDLNFDKFPTPATFACWKIRCKTEVCTCSQFPTEAMQWIKEVELVDSVDELRSSSSTRGISMPNFEVLDARIASALNKIIHNSHFKRKISLEEQKAQKEDRFLRGRQDCLLDLRTIPGHWNPWFCRKLHRPVHYCSSKWRYSGIRF